MIFSRWMLMLLASCLCIPQAGAEDLVPKASSLQPMSLETALMFSLNKNPEIGSSAAKQDQAMHAIDEARSDYYPQINSTIQAGREYNNPTTGHVNVGKGRSNVSGEANLNLDQVIYDGNKTDEEVGRRKQISQSAGLEKRQAYERIVIDTTKNYMQVYRYQKALKEAQNYINSLTEVDHKVGLMVAAGAEDKSKKKFAESKLDNARSTYSSIQSQLDTAVTNLENITGTLPEFAAEKPTLPDLVALNVEKYLKQAEETNSDLVLNDSDRKAAEHELGSTVSRFSPSVHFVMDYGESDDSGGLVGMKTSSSAMLRVNYKIFDGYGRNASEKRIESKIKQIDLEKAKLQRDVRNRVKQAFNQVNALENEYAIVLQEQKTNVELQDLYREQFRLGEGDIINLLDGEEHLFNARIRGYEIEATITTNILQLAKLCGLIDYKQICPLCEE